MSTDAHEEYDFTLMKGTNIQIGIARVDMIVNELDSNHPKIDFDTKLSLSTGEFTYFDFKRRMNHQYTDYQFKQGDKLTLVIVSGKWHLKVNGEDLGEILNMTASEHPFTFVGF